jgi:multiple RNA-binding domain-containing protein 1
MLDEARKEKSSLIRQEAQEDDNTEDLIVGPTATVHVKNLNFATTEDRLREFFAKHVQDVRSVRIPTKVVPSKRVGGKEVESVRSLSLGYGFVEFGSQDSCREVLKSLQGTILDGHALEISPSSSNQQASSSPALAKDKPKQPTKLIVRNVPFQATRKELLVLFGSFGQLKKVRLPKKFDGSHRGFAFVEFLTSKDALSAFKSLSSTHLYGRHLVIEWAIEEEDASAKHATK